MKWIKIPSILIVLLTMSLSARTDLGNDFWLEDNRVTVTCDVASAGDMSTIAHNGKLFTKISTQYNLILNTGDVDAENACTSGVISMAFWFTNRSRFNKNISHWDTSSVTDMKFMFSGATAFNQAIGNWDMSSVTDISSMLNRATKFNQDIGDWNTTSVTDMAFMFMSTTTFNQAIGNWDTSRVTNMTLIFNSASKFNQDISHWCVSKISSKPEDFDKSSAFENNSALQPNWGTCPVAPTFDAGNYINSHGDRENTKILMYQK